jgi:hypothetical protein
VFSVGGDGLTQVEFDYEYTGDPHANWSSFWINSMQNNQWVKDAEMDMLEYMSGTFAHNWAGEGHQVPYKSADLWKGHTTLKIQQTGAQSTDCAWGK